MFDSTRQSSSWSSYIRAIFAYCVLAILACLAVYFGRSNAVAAEKESKQKDVAASRAAFLKVYKVLMHPRCMNCHPDGDRPLQGDDSHIHMMNVKRGENGTGKYALRCGN